MKMVAECVSIKDVPFNSAMSEGCGGLIIKGLMNEILLRIRRLTQSEMG